MRGRLDEGFIVFPRLNERWETSRKVTNGIISWDNMQIMFVSSGRVFITRITFVEIPKRIALQDNGYYNSVRSNTQGLTVRDWLKTQSFLKYESTGKKILQKALNGTL